MKRKWVCARLTHHSHSTPNTTAIMARRSVAPYPHLYQITGPYVKGNTVFFSGICADSPAEAARITESWTARAACPPRRDAIALGGRIRAPASAHTPRVMAATGSPETTWFSVLGAPCSPFICRYAPSDGRTMSERTGRGNGPCRLFSSSVRACKRLTPSPGCPERERQTSERVFGEFTRIRHESPNFFLDTSAPPCSENLCRILSHDFPARPI
jgi:hypothetical protein